MASTSSREAALERRRALTNGGKKAVGRFSSGPSRVRSAADARPTRTNSATSGSAAGVASTNSAPAPAAPSPRSNRPGRRTLSLESSVSRPEPAAPRRAAGQRISNPSRELVLARREALSRSGKRANTSKDRSRAEAARQQQLARQGAGGAATPSAGEHQCSCQQQRQSGAAQSRPSTPAPILSLGAPRSNGGGNGERRSPRKLNAQHNPSRALVLARREALSKRGKSAAMPSTSTAATVARQGNPDLSTRELAQRVRELKSKVGSAGSSRSGGTRPTGPNRHGARQAAAADAHWKVGVSQTSGGQVVTGTQANRSPKTTGNEAATCRPITGTEYLGAEVFQTFCQSGPVTSQPPKVRVTATSHGNRVTGNEVGRSEKVTGDEPGTCKAVTGTEYLSANQMVAYCGDVSSSPRKVGRSQTLGGQPVSGVMVGRSSKVTGDEPGSGLQLTGDQYLGVEPPVGGRAPVKVASFQTLRGSAITGTSVGRSDRVTGDEPGSCRAITGDEYIGSQQYERFCGSRPAPEAPKVGFSITNRTQVVSGTRTGRSSKVTGDEPGTCKAVTGTPYAGLEQAGDFCSSEQLGRIRERTPVRGASRLSGIQPGIGGVMTGAERGACEAISGTPYVGADQLQEACGAAQLDDADFPQPLAGSQPWQRFSVQSPAQAAQEVRAEQAVRERRSSVTGTSYEQGSRITGPFDMAADKVTGTEQFRFDRRSRQLARGPIEPAAAAASRPAASAPVSVDEDQRPISRVTGEGISAGLKITGDDWDRGERVTGTEGASARRRNPTRPGVMSAMPGFERKRNEAIPEPVSRVTGSSGNTDRGSLVTVSGGARG